MKRTILYIKTHKANICIWIVYIVFILSIYILDKIDYNIIVESPSFTNAVVIDHYSIKGRNNYTYIYYIDGKQYEYDSSISKNYYPAVGDTIPIVYAKERPKNSRPLVPDWDDFEESITDSTPGITLKRILNDPIFQYARIVKTDSTDNRKLFSYEFFRYDTLYSGSHSASRYQSPAVGDSIIVVYEQSHPANNVPLIPYINVFKSKRLK